MDLFSSCLKRSNFKVRVLIFGDQPKMDVLDDATKRREVEFDLMFKYFVDDDLLMSVILAGIKEEGESRPSARTTVGSLLYLGYSELN